MAVAHRALLLLGWLAGAALGMQLHPLHDVRYSFRGTPDVGALAPEVEVSFHAPVLGSEPAVHTLRLRGSHHANRGKVHFHDEDGEHVFDAVDRTYTSPDGTFTLNHDGTVHAVFRHSESGETFLVDPAHRHADNPHMPEDFQHEHVIYPMSGVEKPMTAFGVPEGVQQQWNSAVQKERSVEDYAKPSRKLLAVERWSNCYSGSSDAEPRHILLGIAIDHGMFEQFGTRQTMQAEVDRWVANSNMIYEQQLGVQLVVNRYEMHSVPGGPAWNWGSSDNPNNGDCTHLGLQARVNVLGDWVKSKRMWTEALWHIITNCYPDNQSTGYAYLGVLCQGNRGNNVGITQYYYLTWLTFAHEIGHNFRADHTFEEGQGTTGGIMDYADGRDEGWYRFNTQYRKSQVCGYLSTTLSRIGDSCLKPGWPMAPQPVNPQCINRLDTCFRNRCYGDYDKHDCPIKCGVCDYNGGDDLGSGTGNKDCVLSDYHPWQPCSEGCGGGTQLRFRSVTQAPTGSGAGCATMAQKRTCNAGSCGLVLCPRELDWPEAQAGAVVTMGCIDGSSGTKKRTCGSNGVWQAVSEDTCNDSITSCAASGVWPQTLAGATALTSCGNNAKGLRRRTCSPSGTWESAVDTCAQVYYCTATGDWPQTLGGSRATLPCPSGFTGSLTRQCGSTGSWDAVNDGCTETQFCPASGDWPKTANGARAEIGCGSGKRGSKTRQCSSSASWQSVNDQCRSGCSSSNYGSCPDWAEVCGSPHGCAAGVPDCCSQCGSQPNGNRDWMLDNCCTACANGKCGADSGFPKTNSGSWATKSCPSGQSGQMRRQCYNGGWMSIFDECSSSGPSPCDANQGFPRTNAGATATIGCPSGTTGSKTRTCSSAGNWGAINDNCVTAPCDANQGFPRTNAGATATIGCPSGTTGSKTRTCSSAGNWGAINDNCVAPTVCGPGAGFPETPIKTTATLPCSDGFTGEKTRWCNRFGNWGKVQNGCVEITSCSEDAGFPVTALGATARVACGAGFNGMKSRTCSTSGNWGAINDESCVAVALSCSPDSGFPSTTAGGSAQIQCGAGFSGMKSRTCSTSGNWGAINEESCVAGAVSCSPGSGFPSTTAGGSAQIQCGAGFSGMKMRTCDAEGTWGAIDDTNCVADTVSCSPDSGFPSTTAGGSAQIACGAGFSGMKSRACDAEGTWGAINDANCVAVVVPCGPDSGFPQTQPGAVASVACGVGMKGTKTRMCDAQGVWQAPDNTACVAFCDANQGFPDTDAGQTASVACSPGFTGTRTRTCSSNGQWQAVVDSACSTDQNTCAAADGYSQTVVGNVATADCVEQMGTRSRLCQQDQTWAAEDTSGCSDMCAAADPWPATTIGQTAVLDCGDADMQGNKTRACASSGWLDETDNCVLKTCAALDGLPITSLYSSVTVPCAAGFSGDQMRTCGAGGVWGPLTGSCAPASCATEEDWPITAAGNQALLACTGDMVGYQTRMCSLSGDWQSIVDSCQTAGAVTCTVDGQWPVVNAGTTVTLTCGVGKTGDQSRLCGADGVWADVQSTCQDVMCPADGEWPATAATQTAAGQCGVNKRGSVNRLCGADGVWGVLVSTCTDVPTTLSAAPALRWTMAASSAVVAVSVAVW